MKLKSVEIENYRAIAKLRLPLDPSLTVLHGGNTCGKTSVLSAIAVGLGVIPDLLPGVSGIDFIETDLRVGESFMQVDLTAADGLSWKRERFLEEDEDLEASESTTRGLDALKDKLAGIVRADREGNPPVELPIVAFYDTDRAVLDIPEGWRGSGGDIPPYAVRMARGQESVIVERKRPPRYAALEGSLSARAKYGPMLQWFRAKEDEELREQRKRRGFDYHDKALSAVRSAITSMLDGVSEPHIEVRPLRFLVSVKREGGSVKLKGESVKPEDERDLTLEINQLSDGQRAVLALAADLARRMAQGNPHLDDPLESGAALLRRGFFALFMGLFARGCVSPVLISGGQQPSQRVPASFRRPAEPRNGAEHRRSVPDRRAPFWTFARRSGTVPWEGRQTCDGCDDRIPGTYIRRAPNLRPLHRSPEASPVRSGRCCLRGCQSLPLVQRSPADERERTRTGTAPAGPGVGAQAPARTSRPTQPERGCWSGRGHQRCRVLGAARARKPRRNGLRHDAGCGSGLRAARSRRLASARCRAEPAAGALLGRDAPPRDHRDRLAGTTAYALEATVVLDIIHVAAATRRAVLVAGSSKGLSAFGPRSDGRRPALSRRG